MLVSPRNSKGYYLQSPMAQPYVPIRLHGSPNHRENRHESPEDHNDRHTHHRKKRAPGISDTKWDALKDIICESYNSHSGVLKDIMAEMRGSHDFHPT